MPAEPEPVPQSAGQPAVDSESVLERVRRLELMAFSRALDFILTADTIIALERDGESDHE
jgi:hypothetical protein